MLNFLVAVERTKVEGENAIRKEQLEVCLRMQIDNSFALGWNPHKILVATSFPFSYRGVRSFILKEVPDFATKNVKTYAFLEAVKGGYIQELTWMHDLDAWQVSAFPSHLGSLIDKAGVVLYNSKRINAGSVFYRPSIVDLLTKVQDIMNEKRLSREERTLSPLFLKEKVTLLHPGFNLIRKNSKGKFFKEVNMKVFVVHEPKRGALINFIPAPLKELFKEYFVKYGEQFLIPCDIPRL